jgi:hypothetical protein
MWVVKSFHRNSNPWAPSQPRKPLLDGTRRPRHPTRLSNPDDVIKRLLAMIDVKFETLEWAQE